MRALRRLTSGSMLPAWRIGSRSPPGTAGARWPNAWAVCCHGLSWNGHKPLAKPRALRLPARLDPAARSGPPAGSSISLSLASACGGGSPPTTERSSNQNGVAISFLLSRIDKKGPGNGLPLPGPGAMLRLVHFVAGRGSRGRRRGRLRLFLFGPLRFPARLEIELHQLLALQPVLVPDAVAHPGDLLLEILEKTFQIP